MFVPFIAVLASGFFSAPGFKAQEPSCAEDGADAYEDNHNGICCSGEAPTKMPADAGHPIPWFQCRMPSQLSDNNACVRYGLTDAELLAARGAIPLSSPYPTASTQGASVFLPIFSSNALAKGSAPTHAVVWIHGLGGNANTYFCSGHAAARSSGTLSVAPWFGNEQVTLEEWLGLERAHDWRLNYSLGSASSPIVSVYWSTASQGRGGWLSGGDNSPKASLPVKFTTSFDALDAMVPWLRVSHATSLDRVSFVGFSAGAQLVSRWALFSPVAARADVTIVVSDPSSYVYLDERRPTSVCSPLQDTGPLHNCTTFAVPNEADHCDEYDNYKYGLADLTEVSAKNLYLAAYATNDTMLAQAVAAYPHKDVRYLLGTHDMCNCKTAGFTNDNFCYPAACATKANLEGRRCCDTYPDSSTSNALDVTCNAMLQGSNRLQRGRNYISYLQSIAPDAKLATATFDGGHNNSGSFFSDALSKWVFAPARA